MLCICDPLCKNQAEFWDNEHQSLITGISLTLISVFDMALLSQY